MRHQSGNEMHVAREPIELGYRDGAFLPVTAGFGERGGQLRPLDRVSVLAGFDLDRLALDFVTLCGGRSS